EGERSRQEVQKTATDGKAGSPCVDRAASRREFGAASRQRDIEVRPYAATRRQEQLHADVGKGEMAVVLGLVPITVERHGEPLIHAEGDDESAAASGDAFRVRPMAAFTERIRIGSDHGGVPTK